MKHLRLFHVHIMCSCVRSHSMPTSCGMHGSCRTLVEPRGCFVLITDWCLNNRTSANIHTHVYIKIQNTRANFNATLRIYTSYIGASMHVFPTIIALSSLILCRRPVYIVVNISVIGIDQTVPRTAKVLKFLFLFCVIQWFILCKGTTVKSHLGKSI